MEQLHDNIKFQRIDADVTDTFKEETDADALKETTDTLTDVFRKALGNDKLDGQGREAEKCKRFFYDDSLRGESPDAGNDEDVRHGTAWIRPCSATMSHSCSMQTTSWYNTLPSTRMMSMFHMICEQLYDLAMISTQAAEPG